MDLKDFVDLHMKKGERFVPARLQAALSLLERWRDFDSLTLKDHLASKGSSGLKGHETFGDQAHERLGIEPLNRNHGRRSCNLQDWGQDLLDVMAAAGFGGAKESVRMTLIDKAQDEIGEILKGIIEEDPLEIRVRGRNAETIIGDLLRQAEEKGKPGEVAQYLVGAKLMLRFKIDLPVFPANKADSKSRTDPDAKPGDFVIGKAIFEVAVGMPDKKHLAQIAEAQAHTDIEVRLLTHSDRVSTWKTELQKTQGVDLRRTVVTSVDAFVGQNIAELGEFSAQGELAAWQELFDLYNSRWVAQVGTPGIRIVIK